MAVPAKDRYSKEVQSKFLTACKAGQGSVGDCECILHRQELYRFEGEQGKAVAELFVLELALGKGNPLVAETNRTVPVPAHLASVLVACENAHA